MKRYRFCLLLLICFSFISLPQGAFAGKDLRISIGTGGTGGTFFPTGGAVADLITRKCDSIKNATAEVTAASVENAKLVNSGQADMGMIAWVAIVGAKLEDKVPNLRSMWWIHGSDRQWIVPADSDIHSPADFKGKRVVVGAPASATEEVSKLELPFFGVTYNDIKPAFLSFQEGVEALKDGRVDVALVMAGYPNSSVMDIMTVRNVRILDFKPEDLKRFQEKYPFCPSTVIPAKTYKGQDKDIHTFTTPGPMAVNKDLPEQAVYEIVKTVHENQEWLTKNVHKAIGLWRFDPSIDKVCPLHPGAARYYREIGLLK
jgi:TRAP transporter TAXI family solute receptor